MKLKDAMKLFDDLVEDSVLDDSNNEELCLISKLPMKDKFTIECGHSFEYPYLYNEYKKQFYEQKSYYFSCPYCRRKSIKALPYIHSINPITNEVLEFDKPYFRKLNQRLYDNFLCEYTPKTGKNKGVTCCALGHKFSHGRFCISHMRFNEKYRKTENTPRCMANTKNGNRCKKFSVEKYSENGQNYCTIHGKMYENQLKDVNV